MKILDDIGVRVFGECADGWSRDGQMAIAGHSAVFDSDYYYPDTEKNTDGNYSFVLPCHRGGGEYLIHLLETNEALVFVNGCMFLCTSRNDVPCVFTYVPVPADIKRATAPR